jgi:hypothetical protein
VTVRLVVSVHKSRLPSWLQTTFRAFHLIVDDREAAVVTEPDTVAVVDLPAGSYELTAAELIIDKPRSRWLGRLPRSAHVPTEGHFVFAFGESESIYALKCSFRSTEDSAWYEFDRDSNPLQYERAVPLVFSDLPQAQYDRYKPVLPDPYEFWWRKSSKVERDDK